METTNRGVRSKNLIIKTWERCKSMGKSSSEDDDSNNTQSPKPKSWPKNKVSPEGFFSVYVGVGKVKYVVRTECLNHPLFKTLLDEAETEYGYAVNGPLELPCDVAHFENVLMEVDNDGDYYYDSDGTGTGTRRRSSCGLSAVGYNAYQLLSPARSAMVYRYQ